jgi:ribonuclease HI
MMSRQHLTGALMRAAAVMAFVGSLASGCHRGPILPLASTDIASRDPTQDHVKMASFYVREAMRSRELAEEQANRAVVYERLFGPGSDWVTGARLLNQFYENSAREQERQADWHLEMAGQPSNDRQAR